MARSRRKVIYSGGTSTKIHTPAVKPVINKQGQLLASGTPATTTVTSSPRTSTSEQQYLPDETPVTGDGILLAMAILLIFVGWSTFFSPLWQSIWNKKPFNPSISSWTIVGGLLFIFFIDVLARSGDTGNTFAWLFVTGMFLIYIMFNGSNEIAAFFNFLSSNQATAPSPGAAAKKTSTPVVNPQIVNL